MDEFGRKWAQKKPPLSDLIVSLVPKAGLEKSI